MQGFFWKVLNAFHAWNEERGAATLIAQCLMVLKAVMAKDE